MIQLKEVVDAKSRLRFKYSNGDLEACRDHPAYACAGGVPLESVYKMTSPLQLASSRCMTSTGGS
jgi:hypothetical protein